MDVTVVGSCNMDLSTYAPRFPKPGETMIGHKYVVGFGGKGANQCVSAVRLGCKTAMVGKVGNDDNGNKTIDNFKSNGVTTDYMAVTDQSSTGIAAITIADTGENSIVIVPGANLLLTDVDVTAIEDLIKGSKVVGAGDAFVGSLAFYLATRPDLTFENAIQRSSIIASISVQSPGTQYSYPWRKDLQPELFE
ncbi:RBKS [Mytilus edulis]|uniref:RbsK n=1 Tax=Mytilus edulis TaxID=6550 RepID=A0A8S3RBC1_MYTED|nr:RBKS [Mytilus edulis]